MTARLSVRTAGPLVTLQDAGRFGHARFGVPASGPMDRFAHAAANVAVGNDPGATAIEVSLGGVELECGGAPVTIAVTGGAFDVAVAGADLAPWSVASLEPGTLVRVRPGRSGSWAYVAVAGRIDAEAWLGSTSTHVTSGRGGSVLGSGLALTVDEPRWEPERAGPMVDGGGESSDAPLRVVLGPQDRHFEPVALERLAGSTFRLTDAYDRMGVRLDGPPLPLGDALSIASEPIVRGSVQVAGDGVPTVLLADHQTTGGYPKIATLVSTDVDRLVQRRAGDEVRFEVVDPSTAVTIARARAHRVSAALEAIRSRDHDLGARLLTADLIGTDAVRTDDDGHD